MLIIDTGVVLAAADRADPDHETCSRLLEAEGSLVTTALVVAEAAYLIGRQLGAAAEAAFFRAAADEELHVEALASVDLLRTADLIEQYADAGLGGTDASLIAVAERLGAVRIATLDRRHFSIVRPRHTTSFELLP